MVFSIQQVSIVGYPDLMICCNGMFVAVELKASETSPISALQEHNLARIVAVGKGVGLVLAPEGFDKFQIFMSSIANNTEKSAPKGTMLC